MAFKNPAQRRACYAKRAVALRQGVKPQWDCEAFGKGESKKSKKKRKSTKSKSSRKIVRLGDVKLKIKNRPRGTGKVHTGPQGGRYVMYKGRKVYIGAK